MLLLQQEDWSSVPSRLSSEASLLSPHHVTPKDLSTSPRTEDYSICHPCSYHLNVLPSFLSGTSGGKLNPPPAPPARSPTTELSSRSQQAPAWTPAPLPGGQLRNGSLHISDDFESKFTFHSMEDFPPPDEYKPCQKTYPSKIPRSRTPGPWLHAEVAGQSCDDIKGRNAQISLKTLR